MKKITSAFIALVSAFQLYAADYTLEVFAGVVANMKEDILMRQDNTATSDPAKKDIEMKNAQLITKPFTPPFYYGIRVSMWNDDTAWEFEHTHQKLYVDGKDLPANVQNWEITDGFNFFFINRAWKLKEYYGVIVRAGFGPVISHPDVTIYNESNHKTGNGAITYGEGYHMTGFVTQLGLQKKFDITQHWYITTEGRITYAKANVPIANGDMNVQNRAFHFNYGLGYRF